MHDQEPAAQTGRARGAASCPRAPVSRAQAPSSPGGRGRVFAAVPATVRKEPAGESERGAEETTLLRPERPRRGGAAPARPEERPRGSGAATKVSQPLARHISASLRRLRGRTGAARSPPRGWGLARAEKGNRRRLERKRPLPARGRRNRPVPAGRSREQTGDSRARPGALHAAGSGADRPC